MSRSATKPMVKQLCWAVSEPVHPLDGHSYGRIVTSFPDDLPQILRIRSVMTHYLGTVTPGGDGMVSVTLDHDGTFCATSNYPPGQGGDMHKVCTLGEVFMRPGEPQQPKDIQYFDPPILFDRSCDKLMVTVEGYSANGPTTFDTVQAGWQIRYEVAE